MKLPDSSKRPPLPPRTYSFMMRLLAPVEKLLGITCHDFIGLASAREEHPLGLREKIRYIAHRLVCSICRRQERRVKQLNKLAGEVIQKASEDTTIFLAGEARDRIRQRVLEEIKQRGLGSKPGE